MLVIGLVVCDRALGDAAFLRRLRDRRGDPQNQAWVERRGNQIIRTEDQRIAVCSGARGFPHLFLGETGNGMHGSHLHFLVDRAGAAVKRAAEDIGEAKDIVDLIGEVRTPGTDHGVIALGAREIGHDFRHRVGKRHDHGLWRHLLEKLRLQRAATERPRNTSAPSIWSPRAWASLSWA